MTIELRHPLLPFLSCGLLAGLVVAAPGCEPGALAEQCGLVCPELGIADGNAAISGIVSLDAFFSAVITVRDASANVSGTMRAELQGLAASLEIEGYADMTLDQLAVAVSGGIQAKFDTYLEGGLEVVYAPPKCEADLELTVAAAAECDVEVDPGMIEAKCEGKCEVSAEVAAECEANGTLECTGKAPNLQCDGGCQGTCQLSASVECSGSCSGECTGECSSCVGGNCDVQGNVVTNCNGACMGTCQGTCELEAAGTCMGSCEGSCTYTPAMGGCDASATVKCDVSAMADAKCEGKCEGSVTPPEVSAECQASVEAKAKAEVTCTPPSLDVRFAFKAGIDAAGQADFKIWLEGFKTRFAAMAAAKAKLEQVGLAAEGLISAAVDIIPGVVADIQAEGGLSLSAVVGVGCALDQAEVVGSALGSATADIQSSVSAFVMVSGSVGG